MLNSFSSVKVGLENDNIHSFSKTETSFNEFDEDDFNKIKGFEITKKLAQPLIKIMDFLAQEIPNTFEIETTEISELINSRSTLKIIKKLDLTHEEAAKKIEKIISYSLWSQSSFGKSITLFEKDISITSTNELHDLFVVIYKISKQTIVQKIEECVNTIKVTPQQINGMEERIKDHQQHIDDLKKKIQH